MRLCLFILSVSLLTSCSSGELKVTVTNLSAIDRSSELVEIPVAKVEKLAALKEGETYLVKNNSSEIIPSQITYDGKIIFQSGLKAGESALFSIVKGVKQQFPPLVYGRFVQERKDDFAWENDRVAFRIYGPALIATDGPSNGLDVWYKRTSALIINKWYKNDIGQIASYHDDHGEGLDDYKVGRTLGAGAMAPYLNGALWLNENFVAQEVLENGPLRFTFKLTYKDIDIAGKSFGESRTFSLDAGSQLTKVQQEYGVDTTIPVAAGIIKREASDTVLQNNNYLIYTEIGPKAGEVFIGLIFPAGIERVETDNNHFLAITDYRPGQPLTYYTGYGWTKYGFESFSDFEKYMADFSLCLKEPFVITYD